MELNDLKTRTYGSVISPMFTCGYHADGKFFAYSWFFRRVPIVSHGLSEWISRRQP